MKGTLTSKHFLLYSKYMAIIGLFSGGKTKGKKKAAKQLATKIAKAKKTKKKTKTCEFC